MNKYSKDFKLKELKTIDIVDYVAYINLAKKENGEMYSKSWMENMIFTLKKFLKFIINNKREFEEKGISVPGDDIIIEDEFKISKNINNLPKPIPEKELNNLIYSLNEIDNKLYKLSFLLMFFTGLSKIDLLNLKIDCLIEEGKNNYFLKYYRSKTKSHNKKKVIKEVETLVKSIKKLNTQEKMLKHPDGSFAYYLINSGGYKQHQRWFDYWFNKHKDIAKELCSDKKMNFDNITVHRIRHTYASKLRDFDYDILSIKEMLNHKNINTTKNYVKESDGKKVKLAKKVYKKIISSNKSNFKNINNKKDTILKNDNKYKCIDCEYIYSTPNEIKEIKILIKKQKLLLNKYIELYFEIENKQKKKIVKKRMNKTKKRVIMLNKKVKKLEKIN